jgi:putative FmdB family regulatory protein
MPTYEYRCKSCGEHLEVVQAFTDDALTDCPNCGATGDLRKVFGNIGITFKGSGFYKTDSRSGSKSTTATKADDTGSSTSESTTKTETKSEKSETKSEPKTDTRRDPSTSTASSTSAA